MAGKVTAYVYAVDDKGSTHWFAPGDTPPAWASKQITNPKVWDGDSVESTDGPPPKGGKGSGVEAWQSYADASGVQYEDDASRDDIIAALEAAGVPTE